MSRPERHARRGTGAFAGVLVAVLVWLPRAYAQVPPAILPQIRYDPKPGAQVPGELPFLDPDGRTVSLGSLFGSRPLLLVLARYRCDRLCPELLDGVVRALQPLPLTPGRDYDWLVVSLDPDETSFWAGRKKHEYLERYAHPGGAQGWHFLVGSRSAIDRLADAVGCRYFFDPRTRTWAEPMAAVALTPDGRVSSYLLGTSFEPQKLAQALAFARGVDSAGAEPQTPSVGSATAANRPIVTGAPLACFPYSPTQTPRGQALVRAIRIGATLNLLLLIALVGGLLRRERRLAAKGIAR